MNAVVTIDLWTRIRQAQVIALSMAAPCDTMTQDQIALEALGKLDILSTLLVELLAQALAQVDALERAART